jgi:NAD-dependent SIR2 family protein deacetylase
MVTKRAGGELIEVNPETTPLTPFADISVRGTAADVVPRLVA